MKFEVSREAGIILTNGNYLSLFQQNTAAVRGTTEDGRSTLLYVFEPGRCAGHPSDEELIRDAVRLFKEALEE